MNDKYYFDIKHFPKQFQEGFDLAKDIRIDNNGVPFQRVVLCGMGGSSFFVKLLNDYLATDKTIRFKIQAIKGYSLPLNADPNTLYFLSSYSGTTEEVLTCFDEVDTRGFKMIALTSGGELEQRALAKNVPIFKIPGHIQPRLSTGFFIAGIVKILQNQGMIQNKEAEMLAAAAKLDAGLDETWAKKMGSELMKKVPVIYSTDNNVSLAQLSKIKFNENSKTQAFFNFFPELNHNEMVGFTNMIMDPYFIIFRSQFTHPRNHKRIEIFKQLMEQKKLPVIVIDLKGDNVLEEILMGYYFIDHVTYYLALAYNIDPEPVAMVEEFKGLMDK